MQAGGGQKAQTLGARVAEVWLVPVNWAGASGRVFRLSLTSRLGGHQPRRCTTHPLTDPPPSVSVLFRFVCQLPPFFFATNHVLVAVNAVNGHYSGATRDES
jgi:hypothetical protein